MSNTSLSRLQRLTETVVLFLDLIAPKGGVEDFHAFFVSTGVLCSDLGERPIFCLVVTLIWRVKGIFITPIETTLLYLILQSLLLLWFSSLLDGFLGAKWWVLWRGDKGGGDTTLLMPYWEVMSKGSSHNVERVLNCRTQSYINEVINDAMLVKSFNSGPFPMRKSIPRVFGVSQSLYIVRDAKIILSVESFRGPIEDLIDIGLLCNILRKGDS